MPSVFLFTRDLRLADNEALNYAIESAKKSEKADVYACYGFNAATFELLEGIRQHSIVEGLRALDKSISGNLNVILGTSTGEIAKTIVGLCQKISVSEVVSMQSFDPEGIRYQEGLAKELDANGINLKLVGSAYAVKPGTVVKPDGGNYRVYTPFFKAWNVISDNKPLKLPTSGYSWAKSKIAKPIPKPTKESPISVIAGEAFALRTLARFKKRALAEYDEERNRADISGTSHLSHALTFGEIHPRTILEGLDQSPAQIVFRKEIAWREFYADVLHHYPNTLTDYYEPKFKKLRYDTGKQAKARFDAWCQGKTGYPMVDAGMRQLLTEGWMHNRVRMIVASFLVKDLHLEWTWGAAHFEALLSDYDPASNSHGWQWTAGCGTDASPYYRIFNPILQGLKFDPNGDYVRKYIPELRHIPGAQVHEPWNLLDGFSLGYPEPIVDHNTERNESLARLEELKHLD